MFITNGVHADIYFVAAKSAPEPALAGDLDVHGGGKGRPAFASAARSTSTGWRSSDTAELVFEIAAFRPRTAARKPRLLRIMSNFQNERTVIGAMAMGEAAGRARLDARIT